MEKIEALEKIARGLRNRGQLAKLMMWDEDKTLLDNAEFCFDGNENTARQFAFRNKLKFARISHGRQQWFKKYNVSDWDKNKTIPQNAKATGMSINYASSFARRNGLSYLKVTKKNKRVYKPHSFNRVSSLQERIQLLRKSGMTFKSIGLVFNISKQRVHQLYKYDKE